MKNDTPLKWKLKLSLELAPGESVEHDVREWMRGETVDLVSLGLSTEEGKAILSELQTQMVAVQVERHGDAHRCELRYLNAKLAALMPFGKVTEFLNEVLPITAASNAATVRNRTRRVGGRLLRDQAKPAETARPKRSKTLVIGLDGGFVK